MSWKDRAIPAEQIKSEGSWLDRATPAAPLGDSSSMLDGAIDNARGFAEGVAKSATLNTLPYLKAGVAKAGDEIMAQLDEHYEPEDFDALVSQMRKQGKGVSEKAPMSSFAGEMAGFMVPGAGVSKLVKGAGTLAKLKGLQATGKLAKFPKLVNALNKGGTLAAEGAVMGAAYTPDSGFTDVKQRAEDAVTGAAFGAAIPVAGMAAKEGLKATGRGLAKVGKGVLSTITRVPVESMDDFLTNPKRYMKAKPREEVVELITRSLDDLDDAVKSKQLSVSEAKRGVSELSQKIKEGKADKYQEVKDALKVAEDRFRQAKQQYIQGIKGKTTPATLQPDIDDSLKVLKDRVTEGSREAYRILDDLEGPVDVTDTYSEIVDLINNLNENYADDAASRAVNKLRKYSDLMFRKGQTVDGKFRLPGKQIKSILQQIDSDVKKWNVESGSFNDNFDQSLKRLRSGLDQSIKSESYGGSKAYAEQMKKVAADTDLLSRANKAFGKRDQAIGRLSSIDRPNRQIDREVLSELASSTGKDFSGQIDDYARDQSFLRSKVQQEDLFKTLPEASDVKFLRGEAAMIARQKRPREIKKLVGASRQAQKLATEEGRFNAAKMQRKAAQSWSQQSVDSRINQVIRGKEFTRKQLQELGEMADQDFLKMVDDLKVNESFTKDSTRGSRNVNFWTVIGTYAGSTAGGFVVGGPVGGAVGAGIGYLNDKYGPQMAKQILRGVSSIKGAPTFQRLKDVGLPDPVAKDMYDMFQRAIVGQGISSKSESGASKKQQEQDAYTNRVFDVIKDKPELLDTLKNEKLKERVRAMLEDEQEKANGRPEFTRSVVDDQEAKQQYLRGQ